MMTCKMYDISPALTPRTAVFDCDTPLSREVLMDTAHGDRITLSTLRGTVHLGAHADGPNHYGVGGRAIDEQALELYVGPCQVIDVRGRGDERIGPGILLGRLRSGAFCFGQIRFRIRSGSTLIFVRYRLSWFTGLRRRMCS